MGGGESTVLKDKRVVVVGGGYGGANAVSLLRGKCLLTVIDAREYYHYCIGGPRATVEPGLEKKILIPYADAWEGIYRKGMVVDIDPKEKIIHLEEGDEIPYDIVIIATGSKGPFPGRIELSVKTLPEAEELFKEKQTQVKSAKRITVIGAGAVGVEIAAEIATDYPDKEVTVVSASTQIVTGPFKDSFRDGAMKQLKELGVNFILGERVSNFTELPTDGSSPCTVKTDGGMEIESDLIIISTGLHVNSEAYEKHFADSMDENNCLKVNEFLQVEGYQDVFALGDCNNADEVKMGFKAELQMKVIEKNMMSLYTGGKMTPYKEKKVILLTLGRRGGIMQLGSFVTTRFVTRIKSRDVFIERTRKIVLNE